jgi:hypothetical protein
MKPLFGHFAKTEDGNAVIDWVVLMTGVVLMVVSVAITVMPSMTQATDDTVDRAEHTQGLRPV